MLQGLLPMTTILAVFESLQIFPYDPATLGRLWGSPKTSADSLLFEDKETCPRSSRYTLSAA